MKAVRWIGTDHKVVVLDAAGDIDLHRSADFQQALVEPLAQHPTTMIVNLAGVPYMDSAALGALLGYHVSCQREGHRYALTGVSGRIRTLFQVAGVDGFLMCYDTPEQAEAQLATGA